jgi:uncharacterized membrane protein YczE
VNFRRSTPQVAPELQVVTFPTRAELRRRLPRLIIGIIVISVGIALTLQARLGVSPYDVLHQGLAKITGLSFGTVVVLLGLAILLLWFPLGQRFGIGTLLNALSIGFIVDGCLRVLPQQHALEIRWPMLIAGVIITAVGIGLYIGAGLGPGPRDGLMTGLAAKGYPLWLVRTGLELTALFSGWALGGNVGIGTLLFAFAIGPLGHWFLKRLHLGVGEVDPDPLAAVGE